MGSSGITTTTTTTTTTTMNFINNGERNPHISSSSTSSISQRNNNNNNGNNTMVVNENSRETIVDESSGEEIEVCFVFPGVGRLAFPGFQSPCWEEGELLALEGNRFGFHWQGGDREAIILHYVNIQDQFNWIARERQCNQIFNFLPSQLLNARPSPPPPRPLASSSSSSSSSAAGNSVTTSMEAGTATIMHMNENGEGGRGGIFVPAVFSVIERNNTNK